MYGSFCWALALKFDLVTVFVEKHND